MLDGAGSRLTGCSFLMRRLLGRKCRIVPVASGSCPPVLGTGLGCGSPLVLCAGNGGRVLRRGAVTVINSHGTGRASLLFASGVTGETSSRCGIIIDKFTGKISERTLSSTLGRGNRDVVVLPRNVTAFNTKVGGCCGRVVSNGILILDAFCPGSS